MNTRTSHLVSLTTLFLSLLSSLPVWSAADSASYTIGVPQLAGASTGYTSKEIIEDLQAHDSEAVRFNGTATYISFHNEIAVRPGKYRLSFRARMEKPGHFNPQLEIMGAGYVYRTTMGFGSLTADAYVERYFDVFLPGKIQVISLRGSLPDGLILDRISLTAYPDAPSVELLAVQANKLLYQPGESGTATVYCINFAGKEQASHLRIVAESGFDAPQTVYDEPITLAGGTHLQKVTVPLPAFAEWGHQLRGEIVENGKVVSSASDIFAVSNNPLRVGQYGIFDVAKSADELVKEFRRNFQTAAEICFWAPCDMSLLLPPDGKDRWWSGQNLQKFSTEQIRNFVKTSQAQGISVYGYVDYSNVFGYRIFDFGRRFPEMIDWKAQNDTKFVWTAVSDAISLNSPQRSEDDAHENLAASSAARTMHTQPAAIKHHADQLVASMQYFGWDGFRYDDNLDYDGKQVDILGRRAPFGDWGFDTILTYFIQSIQAVNADALIGHNSDLMRTNFDAMYAKFQNNPAAVDALETAILRQGGFSMQEGWSNHLTKLGVSWAKWRDRNIVAGRTAHRNPGDLCIIVDMGNGEPTFRRAAITALMLAAGNHLAYTGDAWHPFLALATRYSDLLYSKELRWLTPEEAAKTVAVESGDQPVWWQEYVRVLPTSAGKRTYLVHLINPPVGEMINESQEADPLRNIGVKLNLPANWKASRAWLVSAERDSDMLGTVLSESRENNGEPEPYLNRRFVNESRPSSEALALNGNSITVPEVKYWAIVAVECDGPASDLLPSDQQPLTPTPVVPDLNAPVVAETFTDVVMANWGPREIHQANPSLAFTPNEQAIVLDDSLTMRVRKNYGLNWGYVRPVATGLYRVSIRCRTDRPLTGDLTMTISSGAKASDANKFPSFEPFTDSHKWALDQVPTDESGIITVEMKWQEMSTEAILNLTTTSPGVQIQHIAVECLKVFDTERMDVWNDGSVDGTLTASTGDKVWLGKGVFHDYFKLEEVFSSLLEGSIVSSIHHRTGQFPSGFSDRSILDEEMIQEYGYIVLADVDMIPFTPPMLDRLRAWVSAGGKLILCGGPYGFGRGEWHLSDLLAPMYPAELGGHFDLQPVGLTAPIGLEPVSALAKGFDWKDQPVLMWQHVMKAKPDATVHITAGGNPVVITRPYGKGNVCFIAAAPLGDAPQGQTAFWDWNEWPKLITEVVKSMDTSK